MFELILQIGNFIVLTTTAIIVFMYTRAAQRSNEIQEEPAINLLFEPSAHTELNHRDGRIIVKNIGRGPAYDIKFEHIQLPEEGRGLFTYHPYIQNALLESGNEATLNTFIRTPEGGAEQSGMSRLLFRLVPQVLTNDSAENHRNNPAIFLVHYFGTNRKHYYSIFIFYCVLAPVGKMVMQYAGRGEGELSLAEARVKIGDVAKRKSHVEE